MLIDWFTVAAQVVNFLILVWLMKRFLYRPILRAIDAREETIAADLADAEATRASAEEAREAFARKNDAFDRQRAALLAEASEDAESTRRRLLEEAHGAADELLAARKASMEEDARGVYQALGRGVQREVFSIAREALADLAGVSLEERMSEAFVERLADLDPSARGELADAAASGEGPAVIRSAFELPTPQREAIERALDRALGAQVRVAFATSPEVVGGVELTVGGRKLAWSIAGYLASLEAAAGELLDLDERPEAAPAARPEPPRPTASPS